MHFAFDTRTEATLEEPWLGLVRHVVTMCSSRNTACVLEGPCTQSIGASSRGVIVIMQCAETKNVLRIWHPHRGNTWRAMVGLVRRVVTMNSSRVCVCVFKRPCTQSIGASSRGVIVIMQCAETKEYTSCPTPAQRRHLKRGLVRLDVTMSSSREHCVCVCLKGHAHKASEHHQEVW